MTTLGDVWAITALIIGMAVCAWAFLMCMTLLFPSRTLMAQDAVEAKPWKCIGAGLVGSLLLGGLGFAMLASPLPVLKLAGWLAVLALMAISFTGSAGLVRLAGERVKEIDPAMTPYGALSRGALMVVMASILPILGWFLFAPVIFAAGVGAGIQAMRTREAALMPPVVG